MYKLHSRTLTALVVSALITNAHAEPQVTDLAADQTGSWTHASGKPVQTGPDPLGQKKTPVSVIPPQLNVFRKEVKVPDTAKSVTFECEAYLENGNFQGGLIASRKGDQEGKGYFFGIEAKDKAVVIGMRGGYTGPWEWFSKTDVTRPAGWTKIKFTWVRDGTLQLYINGDLYLEKEDIRLKMLVDQVQIQTNGDGQKFMSDARLTVEP